MNQEKIGKFIAECRKNKQFTQQELAAKLGVTDKAISKWENGRCLMDISFLVPLSEILDVSILEIINGERVKDKNILSKSDEVLVNTLKYARSEVDKINILSKTIFIFLVIVIILGFLVIYKSHAMMKYYSEPIIDYEEVLQKYAFDEKFNIYKRTLNDSEYLEIKNIRFRNDFQDYQSNVNENYFLYNYTLEKFDVITNEIINSIDISIHKNKVEYFSESMLVVGYDGYYGKVNVDVSEFFKVNDIDDDIDLYNYINENYYAKITMFDSISTMKDKYVLNTLAKTLLADISNMKLIQGDYRGFMYDLNEHVKIVNILKEDMVYVFTFSGEDVEKNIINDNYIIDFVSTLEIK